MNDSTNVPIDADQAHPSKEDTTSSPEEETLNDDRDSISQEKESTPIKSLTQEDVEHNNKSVRSVLIMQIIILALMVFTTSMYAWLHNVPSFFSPLHMGIENYYEAAANFNFIGVNPENPQPTIYAVMLETLMWSLFGIYARSAYSARQSMRGGKFSILEALTKLFADSMMGVSVAIAVVAFLRTTEFANLSLKSADIGSIIAISFILGFYHEDTRRLLGSFQKRISGAARESEKDE